jgi:glycerophosphoryl diester phosphodiesterase
MKRHTQPIIIAHRGASGYLPEHTLAAKALAHAMGADFLEQDVVLTKDGTAIVLHDIYLETTTDVRLRFPGRAREDGRFYALDFTLDEIRQLRLHERSTCDEAGLEVAVYPARFPLGSGTCSIPTLLEEIDFISGLDRSRNKSTGLYVELKAPDWHSRQGYKIAETIIDVLDQTGYSQRPDQVFLQCFHDKTLQHLRNTLKTDLPLIQLIGDNSWGEDGGVDYSHMMTTAGLDAVAEYANGIGPWVNQIYAGKDFAGQPIITTLVEDAHARGLKVHPYTFRRDELPEDVADFDELLDIFVNDAGIDGFFTDFPDLAYAFLRS